MNAPYFSNWKVCSRAMARLWRPMSLQVVTDRINAFNKLTHFFFKSLFKVFFFLQIRRKIFFPNNTAIWCAHKIWLVLSISYMIRVGLLAASVFYNASIFNATQGKTTDSSISTLQSAGERSTKLSGEIM